jgi:hypothetical protein
LQVASVVESPNYGVDVRVVNVLRWLLDMKRTPRLRAGVFGVGYLSNFVVAAIIVNEEIAAGLDPWRQTFAFWRQVHSGRPLSSVDRPTTASRHLRDSDSSLERGARLRLGGAGATGWMGNQVHLSRGLEHTSLRGFMLVGSDSPAIRLEQLAVSRFRSPISRSVGGTPYLRRGRRKAECREMELVHGRPRAA